MIEVYKMRIESLERMKSNSQQVIESYQAYRDPNPLFLLQQKELIVNEEIGIAKTIGDIIETYVDYLSAAGYLNQRPYKNYLSKL